MFSSNIDGEKQANGAQNMRPVYGMPTKTVRDKHDTESSQFLSSKKAGVTHYDAKQQDNNFAVQLNCTSYRWSRQPAHLSITECPRASATQARKSMETKELLWVLEHAYSNEEGGQWGRMA